MDFGDEIDFCDFNDMDNFGNVFEYDHIDMDNFGNDFEYDYDDMDNFGNYFEYDNDDMDNFGNDFEFDDGAAVPAKAPRQPRVFKAKPECKSNQQNNGDAGCNQRSSEGGTTQRNLAGNGSNQRNGGSGTKNVMTVPSDKVGCIIGKGGSKIRELEARSGAKIKIVRSNGNTTEVILSGSDKAVSDAKSYITDVLNYKPKEDPMRNFKVLNLKLQRLRELRKSK